METRRRGEQLGADDPGGSEQRGQEQAHGLPLPLLGDAAGREHRADQEVEGQHVGHVVGRQVRAQEQERRHQGDRQQHAHLDHDPEHQRALAEDLAPQLLIEDGVGPVGHQVVPLGRREELVGEQLPVDDHADGVLHLLLLVDDILALAAHVGRSEEAAVDQDAQHGPGGQAPGRQYRDRDEVVRLDVVGPRQHHAGDRQGEDDEVAHHQGRAGASEVAGAGDAQEPERPRGKDQHQVAPRDLGEQEPAQQVAEDHQRQAGDDQDHQVRERAHELADQDRARPERAGQQHLVRLPLLLAGDAPRREGRRHQGHQEELAEEEDVEEPLGILRPGLVAPPSPAGQ